MKWITINRSVKRCYVFRSDEMTFFYDIVLDYSKEDPRHIPPTANLYFCDFGGMVASDERRITLLETFEHSSNPGGAGRYAAEHLRSMVCEIADSYGVDLKFRTELETILTLTKEN